MDNLSDKDKNKEPINGGSMIHIKNPKKGITPKILIILILLSVSISYACIGQDGTVLAFRSVPTDESKFPVPHPKNWPWMGTQPTVVILVDFQDCAGATNQAGWNSILLTANPAHSSMRDYYREVSYYQTFNDPGLDLPPCWENSPNQGDNNGIIGWLTLNFNHPWNTHIPTVRDTWMWVKGESLPGMPAMSPSCKTWALGQQLTYLALQAADPFINYANYNDDYPQSLAVEPEELHVIIIVAGYEASYSGAPGPKTWRYHWSLPGTGYWSQDGEAGTCIGGWNYGGGYSMLGELAPNGTIIGQGLAAHEMGHDIGLPDLYDTDGSYNGYGDGLGEWCLMAGADWLGNPLGTTPGQLSAWCKIDRGWVNPTILVDRDILSAKLPPSTTTPTIYLMKPYNTIGHNEYFLIEHRMKLPNTFDLQLRGSGLLIYHCDNDFITNFRNSNTINTRVGYTPTYHYGVDVECQDGFPAGPWLDDLDVQSPFNRGDINDPWYLSCPTNTFNWVSIPNNNVYVPIVTYLNNSCVSVNPINQISDTIFADLRYRLFNDVGVIDVAPDTTIPLDSAVITRAFLKNFGMNVEAFKAIMMISDWRDTIDVNLPANDTITVTFAPCTLITAGQIIAKCTVELSCDERSYNDFDTAIVIVISFPPPPLSESGWVRKADFPANDTTKAVANGGALVKAGDYLYAFRGNKSLQFARYAPVSGAPGNWATQCSIRFRIKPGVSMTPDKKYPAAGAALAYANDNENIYAIKGGGTRELWVYSINGDSWHYLNGATDTLPCRPKGAKDGSGLVFLNDKLYLLAGSVMKPDSNNFFRYTPGTPGSWEVLAQAPVKDTFNPTDPSKKVVWKAGSAIAELNGIIYGLRGGTKCGYFYKYDTATNTWTYLDTIPELDTAVSTTSPYYKTVKKLPKAGASMTSNGTNKLYIIKGKGSSALWTYTPGVGFATRKADTIPLAKKSPSNGAALAFLNDRLYLLKGNKTAQFWMYAPTDSKSSEQIVPLTISPSAFEKKTKITQIINMTNLTKGNTLIYYTLPTKTTATLAVYNTLGKLIYTETTDKGFFSVNNLPTGIYFVQFETSGYKVNRKLIIIE